MKRRRRKHTPEFQARLAIEAIQVLKTQTKIVQDFKIHPVTIEQWKNELIAPMAELFASKVGK